MAGISRRLFSRWLLAAPALPAAALVTSGAQDAPKPSAFAACVAASDPALAPDDRARAEKGIAALEGSLAAIRNFKLPMGTSPAFRFSPLLSRRKP